MKAPKLLLAALFVALPLLVAAQDKPAEPAVQVYGTLNVNLQFTKTGGATDPAADIESRFAISTDSSNVGVRGSLALAHELKAVYQCETSAAIDGQGIAGLCGRNSRIGLSGSWGTLFYGIWDTPFKSGHYGTKANDPFGNTDVFGFQGIMGSPGYNTKTVGNYNSTAAPSTLGFDTRAANSVAYWSPKFSGVSFKAQYSVNEFKSADGETNPQLLGAVLNYDQGPLSVGAAVEYRTDSRGTPSSSDLAWRAFAGYELALGGGAFTVLGMFEQLSYGEDTVVATVVEDYSRMGWLLGAKFRTGNHELLGRFSQGLPPSITYGDGSEELSSVTDELAAMSFAVGYNYHLAKSAFVFAYFTQIMNKDLAQYTFAVGGNTVTTAVPEGGDPMALGVGIRTTF